MGFCVWSLFFCVQYLASFLVLESFCLLFIAYRYLMTISILCLFLTVQWVGLQCEIVVVPGHVHLLFDKNVFIFLC